MIEALISMGGLALISGVGLGLAAQKFHVEGNPIVEKLASALPGTNCGNCGFPGCHAYAEAMVNTSAKISLCLPGGQLAMEDLATILGVEPVTMEDQGGPKVAFIREADCIGCTACIKACPVDAIVGANKQSHTVIAAVCTNCSACVEPCPVDCIEMVPVKKTVYDWVWEKPAGPTASLH
ncbi:MAG: electron transport complex subunit RsxB [Magnetococcales bacterium]|nr:electron transport complex subunit RsxB [Magnetococcales bacterium]